MHDKIILVTGSTDGIGKETARQLTQLGATVIVHGRSADRCEAACDDIRVTTGNVNVDFVAADLSSQRQVRQMAAEIIARYDRLHGLINNAGVILLQRQLSEDGLEMSFAVNHLAPFLLTDLLLVAQPVRPRASSMSLTVHYNAPLKLTICKASANITAWKPTKSPVRATCLFTYELAERLKGSGVTPTVASRAWWRPNCWGRVRLVERINLGAGRGALRLSGDFARRGDLPGNTSSRLPGGVSAKANDVKLRREFWNISAQLVGMN
jgi:NAD(P)-dependent dehydrogenase (short-subunit alcohol dehydrogenase family)